MTLCCRPSARLAAHKVTACDCTAWEPCCRSIAPVANTVSAVGRSIGADVNTGTMPNESLNHCSKEDEFGPQ